MTTHGSEESAVLDLSSISMEDLKNLNDSVLTGALRRFQLESADSRDPIAAFGAFNQHSSSPW